MTAKEKAEQLVDKFYQESPKEYGSGKALEYGKRCAIICVDEILSVLENEGIVYGSIPWEQIKSHLQQL